MANPGYLFAASAQVSGTSGSIVIPSGASAGQVGIFILDINPSGPSAPPSGLTELTGSPLEDVGLGIRRYMYKAELTSSGAVDPGDTVTFALAGSSRGAIGLIIVGADAVDTVVNGPTGTMGSTPPYALSTPTTTAADACLLLHIWGILGNTAADQPVWVAPSGVTERVNVTTASGSFRNIGLLIATEARSAGATVARTAESSHRMRYGATTIVLSTPVTRPTANAGPDQTVAAGSSGIQMAGTEGDGGGAGAPYVHTWRIITDTTGGASLSSTSIEDPTVDVGPNSGAVVLGYKVTDTGSVESLEDTVTLTVVGVGTTAVPIATIVSTGWTVEPSGSTGADVLSDGSDATYIKYENPVGTVIREDQMSEWLPVSGRPAAAAYRPSMLGSSGSVTFIVKDGPSTVVATFGPDVWTEDTTVQQFVHELTATQVDAIVNLDDIRFRWEGTVTE